MRLNSLILDLIKYFVGIDIFTVVVMGIFATILLIFLKKNQAELPIWSPVWIKKMIAILKLSFTEYPFVSLFKR